MEEKFGPLELRMNKINRNEIFSEEMPGTHFVAPKRIGEILEELKLEPADEKLRRNK